MINGTPVTARTLLADYSVEMTGRDIDHLDRARLSIPPGTRINITYLKHEDLDTRVRAAQTVCEFGFVPVPHVSARRLPSQRALEVFLAQLQSVGATENVMVVGGDPSMPEGPYEDSLAVIASGLLQPYGVRHVSISGYPEGHPDISDAALWNALEAKTALLREQGLAGTLITQFGFDAEAVLSYAAQVRRFGIDLPIRIGVPGPAGIKRLLAYAARFGVGTSAGIAKKYGLSLTNLLGTAGPDRFLRSVAAGYEPARHGTLKVHFYTFGGLHTTSEWIADFQSKV